MKVSLLILTALGLLSIFPWHQPSAAAGGADDQLDAKIPQADPKKFESVRDAKDWANPYLVIRADGIDVISSALPDGRKRVAAKALQKTLVDLPVSAWPYGKVVAVQEINIRSDGDDIPINQNKDAAKGVLEKLKVKAEWWP